MSSKTRYSENPEGWQATLKETVKMLKKHDIDHFFYGGTLLGWQRDGDFIPWDDDIDVGIYGHDVEKLIPMLKDMLRNGWKKGRWGKWGINWHGNFSQKRKLEVDDVVIDSGPRLRMMMHKKVRVDFICHYKIGDHYYRSLNKRTNRIYRLPAAALDTTSTFEYRGADYIIPADWETILEWEYGEEWKTPNEKNHGHNKRAKQFYKELPIK